MDDSQGSLLPEDDSVFNNLSRQLDDLSSDALVEDVSFSNEAPQWSSTPDKANKPVATRHSPRLRARAASPSQSQSPPRPARRPAPSRATPPRALQAPARPAPSSKPKPGKEKGTNAAGSGTSRLKCPKCPATLANKKTLDTHLRVHVLNGVTSRAPTLQNLLQVMDQLVKETLQEMVKERVIGDLSALVNAFCENLLKAIEEPGASDELVTHLSEQFYLIIKDKRILFPSSIRNAFYTGTNKLLSSSDFTSTLKGNLFSLEDCEAGVGNVFIGNFMLTLCKRVLIFSIRHMRGVEYNSQDKVEYKKRSKDSIESVHFRQLVYHIGGSVVNGFLWKGKIYSEKSHTWVAYIETLKVHFLMDESKNNKCSDEVRHFSEKKDRGGYKHINDEAFSFFLVVFDLIMSLEGEDGSMPPNIIDDNILTSDVVLCLWDSLAGSSLEQEKSLDLLVQVLQSCVKVVQKGILKRRLNEHLLKPINSVAMREKLAS